MQIRQTTNHVTWPPSWARKYGYFLLLFGAGLTDIVMLMSFHVQMPFCGHALLVVYDADFMNMVMDAFISLPGYDHSDVLLAIQG